MATIKYDLFEETIDTFLDDHTSDVGGTWQGSASGTNLLVEAATNTCECNNTGVRTAIGTENPSDTDYTVEAEGYIGGTSTNDRCGVVLRGQDGASHSASSSSYYFLRVTGNTVGNMTWDFFRVASGVPSTTDLNGTVSGTLSNLDTDDTFKLKATISGTGAVVTIVLEYDEDIDGGGYDGYATLSTVTDDHTTDRIVTAGNVGVYFRNTNARMNWLDSYTAGGDVGRRASGRGILRGVARGVG